MSRSLTHAREGGVVVFHIGMTIHAWHRPDLWGPVFTAMPRMVTELRRNRAGADDLGFLGAEYVFAASGPWVSQFWNSVDQLYAYASARDAQHLPAWRAFNRAARRHPGAVGIWHETFVVPPGGIETFYGNGAVAGLGRCTGTVPVEHRGQRARERLTGAAGGA